MSEVDFIDIFGDNLQDLMESRDMSQRELSKESGISNVTISRYIKKDRMPTAKSLVNLALALDCRLDDLIPTYDYVDWQSR